MLPLISNEIQIKIADLQRKHPGVPLDTLIVLAESNDQHARTQLELNRIGLSFLAFEAHLVQIEAQFEEMLSYATARTVVPKRPKTAPAKPKRRTTPRQRLSRDMGGNKGAA